MITDSDALEALRPEVDDLLGALEGFGLPRAELRLAWAFTVKSEAGGTGLLRDMRAQAYAQIDEDGLSYVIDDVQVDPSPDVAAVVRGYLNGLPPERMRAIGFATVASTPEEFTAQLAREVPDIAAGIAATGLRSE